MPTPKKTKIPKTPGAAADLLYKTRQERLDIQKKVDELKALESELTTHLINILPKSDASGVAGKLCRVTVVKKDVPQVKDWPKLYAYVSKNKAFDLLQRRLSDAAVKERWDANKKIPGVDHFTVVTLGVNKL